MANEIPALTFATGHRGVKSFLKPTTNIDTRERYLIKKYAPWVRPADKYEWRHNDVYNVAYPYIYRMFEDWLTVINGGELE